MRIRAIHFSGLFYLHEQSLSVSARALIAWLTLYLPCLGQDYALCCVNFTINFEDFEMAKKLRKEFFFYFRKVWQWSMFWRESKIALERETSCFFHSFALGTVIFDISRIMQWGPQRSCDGKSQVCVFIPCFSAQASSDLLSFCSRSKFFSRFYWSPVKFISYSSFSYTP